MLNIFPIQFLAPFAYVLLRVALGIIFLYLGLSHVKHRQELRYVFTLPILPFGLFFTWYIALAELIIGSLFIAGLYTQIAALLAVLYTSKLLVMYKRFSHPLLPTKMSLFLLLVSSISLLITGAGPFAFDLPI